MIFLEFGVLIFFILETYSDREISIINSAESLVSNADQLILQVLKLNENPKNSINIFEEIRKIFFERRLKMNSDIMKQVFFGFEHRKGIM